jgi:hypothetical protein
VTRYLVDTSVWVAWFRGGEDMADFDDLLDDPAALAVTQLVTMEISAGAREAEVSLLEHYVGALPLLPLVPDVDCPVSADLFRAARRRGHTIRSQIDCMIAAVALRNGATVLHRDADYDRLATVIPALRVRHLP